MDGLFVLGCNYICVIDAELISFSVCFKMFCSGRYFILLLSVQRRGIVSRIFFTLFCSLFSIYNWLLDERLAFYGS
jgi:hypothetical protein